MNDKKELEITNEDIELLIEMKKNCLKKDVYEDDKRLLKSNAITKFLMFYEKNKELKKQLKQSSKDYCNVNKVKHGYAKKLVIIQNQQQEFIEFLEDKIKYAVKDTKKVLLKSILANYKSIMGKANDKK